MSKVFVIFIIIPAVVGAAGWTPCGLEGERVTSMVMNLVMNPYFGYMTAGTSGNGVFWSKYGVRHGNKKCCLSLKS